ncbi:APC family permease [Acidithiobacillus sp. M4-SHS-6]|uniref:APC family permease n=1 Tax=Acidithiobacillus sp. M4-SHS-6 TaxID=3383024 RepID=UPI0039BE435F
MSKVGTAPETLKGDVVSLWGLISQSISGMAPTCDVVAFMTAGAAFALVALPLSYLWAFALMFIEMNTIYHLSKHRASAGGYYAYVAAGLGARPALLTGFMVVFYQLLSVAGIPVYVGGVFLPGLAKSMGYPLPAWFWLITILFFIGVPWILSISGIRPSIRVVAVTSFVEVAFLVIASMVIIAKAAPLHPWAPFSIPPDGCKGVAMGMIFAITSFIGIGSHTPLGEEVRGPRTQRGRLIGKAALLSLTLVGAALVLSAYALTVGWGPTEMASFANADAPGVTVFLRYLGPVGGIALVILAINSAMADSLALLNSSSRVLYAIGRDALISERFAQVSNTQAPQRSITVITGLTILVAVLAVAVFGSSNGFNVLTTSVLFGLVTAHTLMNVSLMRLAHADHEGTNTRLLYHYLLPVIATGLFWWVLYESIVPLAYPLDWSLAAWLGFGLLVLLYVMRVHGRIHPDHRHHLGTVRPPQ